MITCQHARHLFDSYLDGELSASLQTELHAHRLNCSACQNELALLEACGDVIAMDRREPQISASFTDRVLAVQRGRVASKPRRWSRAMWLVGSPMAAAASVALMFSVVLPREHRALHTVTAPRVEAVPPEMQAVLQQSGRQLTPQEQLELQQTPQMAANSFADAVRSAYDRCLNTRDGIRRSTQELSWLVAGLSSGNEKKLAVLWQSVQKGKASASEAERVRPEVEPMDPSYPSQPPAASDSAGDSESNRPVEAL